MQICVLDEELKECYTEGNQKMHGSKEKKHFLYVKEMVLKNSKRAKLKPFKLRSCRRTECSVPLRLLRCIPSPGAPPARPGTSLGCALGTRQAHASR